MAIVHDQDERVPEWLNLEAILDRPDLRESVEDVLEALPRLADDLIDFAEKCRRFRKAVDLDDLPDEVRVAAWDASRATWPMCALDALSRLMGAATAPPPVDEWTFGAGLADFRGAMEHIGEPGGH